MKDQNITADRGESTTLVDANQSIPSRQPFQIPAMANSTGTENNRLANFIKTQAVESSTGKIVPRYNTFDRNFRNTVDLLDYAKRLNEDPLVDLRIRRPRLTKKVVEMVKPENSGMVGRKGYRTIMNDLEDRFTKLRSDPESIKALEERVRKLTTKAKPNQDLVIRNTLAVGKSEKDKIKALNVQKHNQHLKEVLERKQKIDKVGLKKRLKVIEEKDKRFEQAIANERDFGGSLKEVQEKWFTVIYCAVKIVRIKEFLQQCHIEKIQRLKENRSAIVIQRWYRSIFNRARNLEISNALAVISYHFRKYYKIWKAKRLQKASNVIQTFFKEVYDVSKLLKIVKKYRLSVIKSQKYAREFLQCREAKVKVIAKYWDSLEPTWWLQRQKGKGVANSKRKGKLEDIVRVPDDVKFRLIFDDLIARRKVFWKDLIEREREQTSLPEKSSIRAPVFKLLPTQDKLFAMMEAANSIKMAS